MPVKRQTLRQLEILIQLDEQPAKTITELALRLGAQRPSVSRSLKVLKEEGLVCRKKSGWHLTLNGESEATAAKAKLVETTEQVRDAVQRTSDVWSRVGDLSAMQMPSFVSMMDLPGITSAIRQIEDHAFYQPDLGVVLSTAFTDSPIRGITEVIKDSIPFSGIGALHDSSIFSNAARSLVMESAFNSPMLSTLGQALQPILEAQEDNASFLRNIIAASHVIGFEDVARQNNLLLAGVVNDVLAIRRTGFDSIVAQAIDPLAFTWASEQLTSIGQSFKHLFSDEISQVDFASSAVLSDVLRDRISTPTVTVAHYTGFVRNFIEAETREEDSSNFIDFEESGDSSLDPLLHKLNPDFVEMRQGAWFALRMRGPDRLRHAGASHRELLTQLLQHLVPTFELPEDNRQGPQIKTRLKIALGVSGSNADFIGAVAEAVYEGYRQLNKYTHHNERHEESLQGLLQTIEGLIRFILANTDPARLR